MFKLFLVVLAVCAVAADALVTLRLVAQWRGPRLGRGRILNEWIWTGIPMVIFALLLWRVLK